MADTNDMMNNLMGILNNSDAKNKLMDAISALGSSSGQEQQDIKEDNSNVSSSPSFNFPAQLSNDQTMDAVIKIKSMLDRFNNISDDRIGLLNAIRPYMRAGKTKNIDMAINFIKILNFSNSFRM